MAIPIDLRTLIDSRMVENNRVEYKEGWNPEAILHSICAFANDYDNVYGGYIVLGVKDDNGMPSKDSPGIPAEDVDRINKDLLNLVNRIEPKYEVDSSYEEYNGIGMFIIWAPGGHDRPYKCPIGIGKKDKGMGFYIRKQSSTVRANPSQEKNLFRISDSIMFDDRPNYTASIEDLDLGLIREYLANIGSRKSLEQVPKKTLEEICFDLRIVTGPTEFRKPLNVGLLFFTPKPSEFIRCAYVEVVTFPDVTGSSMISKRFDGPLDQQIKGCVAYIESSIIQKRTDKVPSKVESKSFYNYPLEALEEVIVNAVLHKDYMIPEPVTVHIYNDRIEVMNIPGPLDSIPDSEVRNGTMRSTSYRNRRIGDFLERLDLAEVKNSGMLTIASSMITNESPAAIFETDKDRSYLRVILPINRAFLKGTSVSVDTRRTFDQILKDVITLLSENEEMSLREISERMGYKSIPTSLRRAVTTLFVTESIEYTEDNPNNPNQKLRLKSRR